jgi:uncharacterized protein YegL
MPIEVDQSVPRRLPVLVLADTSGSMGVDGKLEVLNDAIRRMVEAFSQIDVPDCDLGVAVVSFGGEQASFHLPFTRVAELVWEPLAAAGRTPMGQAFDLVCGLLEDPHVIPPRSYPPHLILVSDGIPTDDWRKPLARLAEAEQARRALRFAVGIGADAKIDVLRAFAGPDGEVVPAEKVEMLTEFFRFVTYTVGTSIHRPVASQAEVLTFADYPSNDALEF